MRPVAAAEMTCHLRCREDFQKAWTYFIIDRPICFSARVPSRSETQWLFQLWAASRQRRTRPIAGRAALVSAIGAVSSQCSSAGIVSPRRGRLVCIAGSMIESLLKLRRCFDVLPAKYSEAGCWMRDQNENASARAPAICSMLAWRFNRRRRPTRLPDHLTGTRNCRHGNGHTRARPPTRASAIFVSCLLWGTSRSRKDPCWL